MTEVSEDVVTALKEDLEERFDAIPELKGKHWYIYATDQVSATQQRFELPAVMFVYIGMRHREKRWEVVFDVMLLAVAESLTQIKGNRRMPVATELLQRLRKEIACNKPRTNREWVLESETPDFSVDDKLVYRQRWVTSYQIIR